MNKRLFFRAIIIILLSGFLLLLYQLHLDKLDKQRYYNHKETTSGSNVEDQSMVYSGQTCSECGTRCKTATQVYSSGDVVSSYHPYYLCGRPECLNRRYERNVKWKDIERQEQHYREYMTTQDPQGEADRQKLREWMAQ